MSAPRTNSKSGPESSDGIEKKKIFFLPLFVLPISIVTALPELFLFLISCVKLAFDWNKVGTFEIHHWVNA